MWLSRMLPAGRNDYESARELTEGPLDHESGEA
jgi:hypothetical protein